MKTPALAGTDQVLEGVNASKNQSEGSCQKILGSYLRMLGGTLFGQYGAYYNSRDQSIELDKPRPQCFGSYSDIFDQHVSLVLS